MRRLADALDRLRYFPSVVADVATLRAEMDLFLADAPHATLVREWWGGGLPEGAFRPLSLMPVLRGAPIALGLAVGWHGISPSLAEGSGEPIGFDGRLLAGHLIRAAKQYDDPRWTTDIEDVHRIGMLATWALASMRIGREPNVIVPMPSSRGTNTLPALIARDMSFLTRIPAAPADAIRFVRPVAQVKEVRDYWEKVQMLDGSMWAEPTMIRNRHVLIVDDVCRSGVTFRECASACRRAGASSVAVLAVSKTWRFQRLPSASAASETTAARAATAIEPYDAL